MADFPYDRDVDAAAEHAHRSASATAARRKHPALYALAVADALVAELAPACDRIEIAGSLRRGEREVGDIELVCIPRLERDLFGAVDLEAPTELDRVLERLEAEFRIARRLTSAGTARWGPRAKYAIAVKSGIPVDLFAVLPPAQWGAILAIRTGPKEYSERLVTTCKRRGLRCEDGRLVRPGEVRLDGRDFELATPEERDFIEACGLPYLSPEQRR